MEDLFYVVIGVMWLCSKLGPLVALIWHWSIHHVPVVGAGIIMARTVSGYRKRARRQKHAKEQARMEAGQKARQEAERERRERMQREFEAWNERARQEKTDEQQSGTNTGSENSHNKYSRSKPHGRAETDDRARASRDGGSSQRAEGQGTHRTSGHTAKESTASRSQTSVPECFRDLGFESLNVTAEDVKKRYRQLVKKAHPDAGGNNAAFIRLQAAREACLQHLKHQQGA